MKPGWALLIIILSTLAYSSSSAITGMYGYDMDRVPNQFYQHYCLLVACLLFLLAVYSVYLYASIPISNLKTKLLLLWLMIAETLTFVDHIARKYVFDIGFSLSQFWITLLIFSICYLFVMLRAFKRIISDRFDPRRDYIMSFLPDSFLGLLNFLWHQSGHKAIYTQGYIYQFRRATGLIEKRVARSKVLTRKDVSFTEIQRVYNIDRLVGKRFNLFFYNCNHLVRDAQRAT